jgi:hypothetical protein
LPDVLDWRVQPSAGGIAAFGCDGIDGALRAESRLRAFRNDEPGVEEPADRPVDDSLRYLPDPPEVAAGGGALRDREAMRGLLADDGEHQPLRERHHQGRFGVHGTRG